MRVLHSIIFKHDIISRPCCFLHFPVNENYYEVTAHTFIPRKHGKKLSWYRKIYTTTNLAISHPSNSFFRNLQYFTVADMPNCRASLPRFSVSSATFDDLQTKTKIRLLGKTVTAVLSLLLRECERANRDLQTSHRLM